MINGLLQRRKEGLGESRNRSCPWMVDLGGGGGIDDTVNDFKVIFIVTLFRVGRLVY